MPELDGRLSVLFRAVFPTLNPSGVRAACRNSVAEWDSIAAVTLMTLIEEEFGERFDLEDAAEWSSYGQILNALKERIRG